MQKRAPREAWPMLSNCQLGDHSYPQSPPNKKVTYICHWPPRGQLISKRFFGVIDFLQKTKERI